MHNTGTPSHVTPHKKPRICGCIFRGKAFKPTRVPHSNIEMIMPYPNDLEAPKLCDVDSISHEEAGHMKLNHSGIRVYKAAAGTVSENPALFAAGSLSAFSRGHVCGDHADGSACSHEWCRPDKGGFHG